MENKTTKSLSKKAIMIFSVLLLGLTTLTSYANNRSGVVSAHNTFSLTVKVDHLRNSKGVVQFSLYNKEGSIPDEKYTLYYKQLSSKIKNGESVVTFTKLPAGKYAVNILHDENQNKKIDKGFMLPIEGVGFTNYQSIGLRNRPNFKKASFNLNANNTKTIKVIYF